MDSSEFRELKSSLAHVVRVCKAIKWGSLIALVCFSLICFAYLIALFISFADQGFTFEEVSALVYCAVHGVVVSLLLAGCFRMFSDVVGGGSPFTTKQVKRIRLASLLLVILVVTEVFLSTDFSTQAQVLGVSFGMTSDESRGPFAVNVAVLLFAMTLFGFSVLFRYGVLLQRLSDETA